MSDTRILQGVLIGSCYAVLAAWVVSVAITHTIGALARAIVRWYREMGA